MEMNLSPRHLYRQAIRIMADQFALVFAASFLLLFLSRIFTTIDSTKGLVFIAIVFIWQLKWLGFLLFSREVKERYAAQLRPSLWYIFLLGFIGTVAFVVQSDLVLEKFRLSEKYSDYRSAMDSLKTVLQGIYIVGIVASAIFAGVFQSSVRSSRLDNRRSSVLRVAAVNVFLLSVLLVLINFAANIRPTFVDMTTLRKFSLSKQGEALVRGVTQPVEITAFYPFFHELHKEVNLLLTDLQAKNPHITVKFYDALRDKEMAEAKHVANNGVIVIESIDEKEMNMDQRNKVRRITVVNEDDLKKMERDILSAILGVVKKAKKIYFTSAHGELSYTGPYVEDLVSILQDDLKQNNYQVDFLNAETGFPPAVPADADMVAILGSAKTFNAAEQKTLLDYLQRGGKILVALDPKRSGDFGFLLETFELRYSAIPVLSQYSDRNDRGLIHVSNYTSHAIVNRLIPFPDKYRVSIWPGTGSFQEAKKDLAIHKMYDKDFFVTTYFQSWEDKVRNQVQDEKKEPNQIFNLAVAVSLNTTATATPIQQEEAGKKAARLRFVAFADMDFLTNQYIGYGRNQEIAINAFKWLLEDEEVLGILPHKMDEAKVTLEGGNDDFVMYFLVLLWPFLILFIGFARMRMLRKAPAAAPGDAGETAP